MPKAFDLTARLKVAGPVGLDPVIRTLKSKLSNISANIDIKIGRTATDITKLTSGFDKFNKVLSSTVTNASEAANAINKLGASIGTVNFSKVATDVKSLSSQTGSAGTSFRAVAKEIDNAAFSAEKFGRDSALAFKRFLAFTIPTSSFFAITAGFIAGTKAAVDFERQMVKIAQTLQVPVGSLKSLQSAITGLSTGLGVSSDELVDVALVLNQAGLSAKEAQSALSVLAKTALSPSFDNMKDSAEGLIAVIEQFGVSAAGYEEAFASINQVSAQYAVESSDIITAIKKTGGAFKASGGTLNELVAIFSSIRSTTRESADTIATGLRTISGRLQRTDTIELLRNMGIELRDATGNFVGTFEAFQRIGKGLSSLDSRSAEFAQLVEAIGGLRQLSKVVPAIQQYAKAQEILNVANASGESLTLNTIQAQQSLGNQVDKLKEQFLDLFRTVADSTSFKLLAAAGLGFANAAIQITKAIVPLTPALVALGAIKLGNLFKGSPLTGFAKGFGSFFGDAPTEGPKADPLSAILERRAKADKERAKAKAASDKESQKQSRLAAAEQIRFTREQVKAEKEAQKQADKKQKLDRQARIDAENFSIKQQKLAQGKIGGTSAGSIPGLDNNTTALIKLTASVDRLTSSIGGRSPNGGPRSGGSGARQAEKVVRPGQPLTAREIRSQQFFAGKKAQRAAQKESNTPFFVSANGVAGRNINDVREASLNKFVNKLGQAEKIQQTMDQIFSRTEASQTANRNINNANANRSKTLPGVINVNSLGQASRNLNDVNIPGLLPAESLPPRPLPLTPIFGKKKIRSEAENTRNAINRVLQGNFVDTGGRGSRQIPKLGPVAATILDPQEVRNASSGSLDFANQQIASQQAAQLKQQRLRSRLKVGGVAAGLAGAIVAPSIANTFTRPEDIEKAKNTSTSLDEAKAISRRESTIGAVGNGIGGILTGASIGGALGGPAGAAAGAVAGAVSAIVDFTTSVDRLDKEIIAGRLSNAVDGVSTALEQLAKGDKGSLEAVRVSLQALGTSSGQSIGAKVDEFNGPSFKESGLNFLKGNSGAIGAATPLIGPLISKVLGGLDDETIKSVGQTDLLDAFRSNSTINKRKDAQLNSNKRAIQQEAASASQIQLQTINTRSASLLKNGGTAKTIGSDKFLQNNLVNNRDQQLLAATRSATGLTALAQGNTDAAAAAGKRELENNIKAQQESAKIIEAVNNIRKTEQDALGKAADTILLFERSMEEVSVSIEKFSFAFDRANKNFGSLAGLSTGNSGTAFRSDLGIDTNNFQKDASLVRSTFGFAGANRISEISGFTDGNSADPIINAIKSIDPSSITAESTLLNQPAVKAALSGITNESDRARVTNSITGGKVVAGDDLRELVNTTQATNGSGIRSGLSKEFGQDLKPFESILKIVNEQLSAYATNLEQVNQITAQNNQIRGRIDQKQLDRTGLNADLQSALTGRNRDRFISDEAILRPELEERKRQLTPAFGANNSGNIGARAIGDKIISDTNRIASLQQEAKGNVSVQRRIEITEELNRLGQSVKGAQDALNGLATSSAEAENLQRKLNVAVADRQARENQNNSFGRLGFKERLTTRRDIAAFERASKNGKFTSIGEQQRALRGADFLGGDAIFDKKTGETVDEARKRIFKGTEKGLLKPADDSVTKNEVDIRKQQIENNKKQADAMGEMIRVNTALNETLATSLGGFKDSAMALAEAMNNFTPHLTLEGKHDVNVNINGADLLAKLEPAVRDLVTAATKGAIDKVIRDRFPESGPPR